MTIRSKVVWKKAARPAKAAPIVSQVLLRASAKALFSSANFLIRTPMPTTPAPIKVIGPPNTAKDAANTATAAAVALIGPGNVANSFTVSVNVSITGRNNGISS